jgi:hypothetical protein
VAEGLGSVVVAQRHGEGIGGIGLGGAGQLEHGGDHVLHLLFGGVALAHRGLLISEGVYSLMLRPIDITAQMAAPRAWPSLRAESGLRCMNTCSIATCSGA